MEGRSLGFSFEDLLGVFVVATDEGSEFSSEAGFGLFLAFVDEVDYGHLSIPLIQLLKVPFHGCIARIPGVLLDHNRRLQIVQMRRLGPMNRDRPPNLNIRENLDLSVIVHDEDLLLFGEVGAEAQLVALWR